jgi:hypothetical protein
MDEINEMFKTCKTRNEEHLLSQNLYNNEVSIQEKLTPWSYSLYTTLPEFLRK